MSDPRWRPLSEGGAILVPLAVAGVAALVMQANPTLMRDPRAVVSLIRRTARPVGDATCGVTARGRRNNTGGYGIVDAGAAVALALRMTR